MLCGPLTKLLRLILAIPSVPPTNYLQIAFLLRYTASVSGWIAGYPLLWPSGYSASSPGSAADRQQLPEATIRSLLYFLQRLDEAWQVVLIGSARKAGTSFPQDGSMRSAVFNGYGKVRQKLGKVRGITSLPTVLAPCH